MSLSDSYPFTDEGVIHEIIVRSFKHLEDGALITGVIMLESIVDEMESPIINFFDINYSKNKDLYEQGRRYSFRLSSIAHLLEKVVPGKIGPMNIEPLRKAGVGCVPSRNNPFESLFQCPVRSIEKFIFQDKDWYKIIAPLFRFEGVDGEIPIFVSKEMLQDYIPKSGDDITGKLKFFGLLV